jgi:phosphomannomutase / phosphoglucomutase
MNPIDPRIFRAYDIRGKAYEQITEDACRRIGRMFGIILKERYGIEHPRVVVGRDARTHSPAFMEAAADGLTSAGCHVLHMGETPTPLNYFTVCAMQLDGGLQVTASHNPKDDNGIKLQGRMAEAFSGEDLQMLRRRLETGEDESTPDSEGINKDIDALSPYLQRLETMFGKVGAPKKVVVDFGNGVAGPLYSRVLEQAGCTLISLYADPDGEFPNHPADPSQHSSLKDLQARVVAEKADLGLAFDGDGDRVGLVDENGKIRTSDEILLLLARDFLTRHKGSPVVFTVSNSGVLESEIEAWGGKPVMCKVGHSFVEHAMREHHAALGGEQSGHFFCEEDYYGFDDAMVTALHLLRSLEGKTPSAAMADFPPVFQAQERRPHCPDDAKGRIIASVIEHFSKTHPVNTLDGARIDFGGGAWAGIRQSNTSPKLSICIEARSEQDLQRVEGEVMEHLRTYPEIDWSH